MPLAPIPRARLQATLACAGALVVYYWRGGIVPTVLVLGTFFLALIAWVAPRRYLPVQGLFDRGIHRLLQGITWLLLGLIYCLVFIPLHLGRALLRIDPLQRRPDRTANTYLRPLPPGPARFDRQF